MRKSILQAIGLTAVLSLSASAQASEEMLELAVNSGCSTCHSVAPDPKVKKPLAPSYQDVAARYRGVESAYGDLVDRVLYGSIYRDQNWEGKVSMRFMPPNVNVTRTDAIAMVRWILTLEGDAPMTRELQAHEASMALAASSGCMTCHNVTPVQAAKVVPLAPSFREIAAYYDGQKGARGKVLESVLNGTQGMSKTWDHVNMRFMPANVALRKDDAESLVDWVLGLDHADIKVMSKSSH